MTTQPSDWAVARAFWEAQGKLHRMSVARAFSEEVMDRARELDASGCSHRRSQGGREGLAMRYSLKHPFQYQSRADFFADDRYFNYFPRKPAGYMKLWEGYFIEVKNKPSDEHLKNMEQAFGWKWVDDIS